MQLREDATALARPDVREALLSLVDREDELVVETLRESDGQVGVSVKFGEEFGEYLALLSDTVDSFADWTDPRHVCILVRASYDPESQFAAKIAAHGTVSLPCLIETSRSDVWIVRAQVIPVMVQALARSADSDSIVGQAAKQIIVGALHDPSSSVRRRTVRALADYGGQDMIAPLRQLAEGDPVQDGRDSSIRNDVEQAIAKIEQRAGVRP
jgi:hypothetical protein